MDRQPVPDLMKGIAVVAMVQVHIMEQLVRPEIAQGPAGEISLFLGGPFAAPVFMAVMGYFAAASSRGPWHKAIRGIKLILLGFVLNVGLNFSLLYHIFSHRIDADPLPYLLGVDILFLAGAGLIFIGIMEMALRKRAAAALALAILLPVLTPWINDLQLGNPYLKAFISGSAPWSYFPVFPWLAYPLLGYSWGKVKSEQPGFYARIQQHLSAARISALVILLLLAVPAFREITDLPAYYHHAILLFTWNAGFLVLWPFVCRTLEEHAGSSNMMRYLKWLGAHVTVVYVVQWLIIGNLAFFLHGSQFLLQSLVWFALILLLTSFITYGVIFMRRSIRGACC